MWHVSSRSGVATLRTAIHLLLYLLTFEQIVGRYMSLPKSTRSQLGSKPHPSKNRHLDRLFIAQLTVTTGQTHRQTGHTTPSIAIGRIYAMHVMQPKRKSKKAM